MGTIAERICENLAHKKNDSRVFRAAEMLRLGREVIGNRIRYVFRDQSVLLCDLGDCDALFFADHKHDKMMSSK